jgi:hypothetical protein
VYHGSDEWTRSWPKSWLCNGLSSNGPVPTVAMRKCGNGLSQIDMPVRRTAVSQAAGTHADHLQRVAL